MVSKLAIRATLVAGIFAILCTGCATTPANSTASRWRFDNSPGLTTSTGAGDFLGRQIFAEQNPDAIAAREQQRQHLAEVGGD